MKRRTKPLITCPLCGNQHTGPGLACCGQPVARGTRVSLRNPDGSTAVLDIVRTRVLSNGNRRWMASDGRTWEEARS